MCGIFGLTTNFNISFKDLNYEIKNFVRYSDTRGSDAFGISIKTSNVIVSDLNVKDCKSNNS